GRPPNWRTRRTAEPVRGGADASSTTNDRKFAAALHLGLRCKPVPHARRGESSAACSSCEIRETAHLTLDACPEHANEIARRCRIPIPITVSLSRAAVRCSASPALYDRFATGQPAARVPRHRPKEGHSDP